MGLMGRPSLAAGAGLWLPDSNGIHMMFMRFPIDAVFVGRPDGDRRRAAGRVASIAACARGSGSCRSCAARTACWSCRSARSTRSGTDVGDRDRDRVARRRSAMQPRAVARAGLGAVIARWSATIGCRRGVGPRARSGLPAHCVGCGREGPPICARCAAGARRRLDLPAGVPIGLPADLPAPLLQLEWCAPFAGRRSAARSTSSSTAASNAWPSPLGAAVARRWARVGRGGDVVVPVPVHADAPRTAATTRPS